MGCIIDSRLVVATAIAARCRTNEFEAIVSFAPRISFDLRVTSVYSANFRTVKIGGNETSAVAVKDEVTHKCATSANDRGFSHVLFCDTQREAPSPLSRDREIIPLTCSRRRGEKFRAGDGACLSLSISLSLSPVTRARGCRPQRPDYAPHVAPCVARGTATIRRPMNVETFCVGFNEDDGQ